MIPRMSDKHGSPATVEGLSNVPAYVTEALSVTGSGQILSPAQILWSAYLSDLPVNHPRGLSTFRNAQC
jgi:hypothetical protein